MNKKKKKYINLNFSPYQLKQKGATPWKSIITAVCMCCSFSPSRILKDFFSDCCILKCRMLRQLLWKVAPFLFVIIFCFLPITWIFFQKIQQNVKIWNSNIFTFVSALEEHLMIQQNTLQIEAYCLNTKTTEQKLHVHRTVGYKLIKKRFFSESLTINSVITEQNWH